MLKKSTEELKKEAQQIFEEFSTLIELLQDNKNRDPYGLTKILINYGRLISNFHMRLNRLEEKL